ncbi:tautomerase family protein [Noviherbaspirillum sedimenti]|uniref:4-oxalocrotonate tautomerase family protein n=1 Tax=Noviherbaspirillum sedimenti TaxID=2320865 RepID=A0A3A3G7U3_9BURK|nr:4-oxalocrotonate tautomerase family protein [Noviherbaspirillum sedimenti]
MPLLRLACAKHPTPEQRKRLIQRLTSTIVEELGVPVSSVNVLIEEVPPSHWGVGGVGLDEIFSAHDRPARNHTS